ncbi:hypothetical protein [Microbacterium sp. CPCC 204701]|uniref:hypothetical protein n=1 Tax=Microbacterium sp. CPCC 204701 TaxID=2493084 RepID=UPI000FD9F282|nr:hypothetical protein [Microbacterium sp. CPCC 204701]
MCEFRDTIVPWADPGADTRSEAGVGVLYSPDFTLGTVDFQPIVNVDNGMLASVLENFPAVSAGSVTLTGSGGRPLRVRTARTSRSTAGSPSASRT